MDTMLFLLVGCLALVVLIPAIIEVAWRIYYIVARLKHPDFALALKRLSYAEHRRKSHNRDILAPMSIYMNWIRTDLLPRCVNNRERLGKELSEIIQAEINVSENLKRKVQEEQEKVQKLAKDYGIRLDKLLPL
jgi:hypothetical protein